MACEIDLFSRIEAEGAPISTAKLAEITGAEQDLIVRLLRLLAGVGFVHEEAENMWSANPTTSAMATPGVAAGARMIFDLPVSAAFKGPKYLRETGFASPKEPRDGFVQYNFQTKLSAFEYLASQPKLLADFNAFMGNTMGTRAYWYDWYPVEDRLLQDLDPSSPLLVDIGGGRGHDLQAFHEKFTGYGELILLDLPQALSGIKADDLDPSIEKVEYDFFKEQPVKNARAYFMHHILHDWSDKYCLHILGHIREAMKPGYSKLLIHDLVLPNRGATAYQCIYDMLMMSFNGGAERSRKQWSTLLEQAGFDVSFWVDDEDADGIIEAVIRV